MNVSISDETFEQYQVADEAIDEEYPIDKDDQERETAEEGREKDIEKSTKSTTLDVVLKPLPLSFMQPRHIEVIKGIDYTTQPWRMKERMKTVSVALVLCLNVGVDPPDVVKTQPCARLECWIDPLTLSAPKSLEKIGATLQGQYERWQPRARYKQSLDPTSEDVKKLCASLRRNAKDERVLFHYNGHGVPRPTHNGEIWVFNRSYTQYIPLSIYDLQTWMGAPSIYVYDCSNAGIIIDSFKQFARQHQTEFEHAMLSTANAGHLSPPTYDNCIQLAACGANQSLPMNPGLPADVFTSCLTTPIKMALRWYVLQKTKKLVPKITLDLIDKMPGVISDRKSMLGELNWIFTAITDTIAWNLLSRDLFQKLFRQDLLVASLFRNYLLAERILKSCDCTPVSSPALPPTHQHPMWRAWDLALDLSLSQLPAVINRNEEFKSMPFFEEQLTAFQVWLDLGSKDRTPPEQLPIVLQVLLSQVHRNRALDLLGRFLDLGPWAVNLALSVGIFPYVLKLLQSNSKELRPSLVFIWAKILAVDNLRSLFNFASLQSCQTDLSRDGGPTYFLNILQDTNLTIEIRIQSAFVLASIASYFQNSQELTLQSSLLSVCLEQLNEPNPHLRQWVVICLGKLWNNNENAKWTGVRDVAHEKLYPLLKDRQPEVRTAVVYALGTFINATVDRSEHAIIVDNAVITALLAHLAGEGSSMVRMEILVAIQPSVFIYESMFLKIAATSAMKSPSLSVTSLHSQASGGGSTSTTATVNICSPEIGAGYGSPGLKRYTTRTDDVNNRMKRVASSSSIHNLTQPSASRFLNAQHQIYLSHASNIGAMSTSAFVSIHMKIWNHLEYLRTDPHHEISIMTNKIFVYINGRLEEQEAANESARILNASSSLPPSPNRSSYLTGDSPPTSSNLTRSTLGRNNRMRHPGGTTIAEESDEKNKHKRSGSAASGGGGVDKKSLERRKSMISTQFVEWCSKRFTLPGNRRRNDFKDADSDRSYERNWRKIRNQSVFREANNECERIKQCQHNNRPQSTVTSSTVASSASSTSTTLLPTQFKMPEFQQVFSTRTSVSPTILKFHPFEQQIAVAGRDHFGIWDWGTGAKTTVCQATANGGGDLGGIKQPSRITAMEWINAHDVGMLMVAADDGSLRIWRPNTGIKHEPTLISAWQAITDMRFKYAGPVLSWEQTTQTAIVAGDARTIRFWDVQREQYAYEIQTDFDHSITCIDSSFSNSCFTKPYTSSIDTSNIGSITSGSSSRINEGACELEDDYDHFDNGTTTSTSSTHIDSFESTSSILSGSAGSMCRPVCRTGVVVCGAKDGSVLLYDRRVCDYSSGSCISSYSEHNGEVIGVNIDDDNIYSACNNGRVIVYDIRQQKKMYKTEVIQNKMSCFSLHQKSLTYACGSMSQNVNVYDLEGNVLNTIKSYEGFMGHRNGAVTCLSYHPLRVLIATGIADCAVNVYSLEGARR